MALLRVLVAAVAALAAAAACGAAAQNCGSYDTESACQTAHRMGENCCWFLNELEPRPVGSPPQCDTCIGLEQSQKARLLNVWREWKVPASSKAFELDTYRCPSHNGLPVIGCNEIGEVTGITFYYKGLDGDLGHFCEIAHFMPKITRIILTGNQLYGQIPTCIAALTRLVEFRISHNRLRGDLPGLSNLQNLLIMSDHTSCQLVEGGGDADNLHNLPLVGDDENCFNCNDEWNYLPVACQKERSRAFGFENDCLFHKGIKVTACPDDVPVGTTTTSMAPPLPTGGNPTNGNGGNPTNGNGGNPTNGNGGNPTNGNGGQPTNGNGGQPTNGNGGIVVPTNGNGGQGTGSQIGTGANGQAPGAGNTPGGIDTGAVVGIIIGVILLIACIIAVIVVLVIRKRKIDEIERDMQNQRMSRRSSYNTMYRRSNRGSRKNVNQGNYQQSPGW